MVGAAGIFPSLEDAGIPAFEAECEDVESDIRACFVDHSYHSERDTDFPQEKAVWQDPAFEFHCKRRWQGGYVPYPSCYFHEAFFGELQPVVKRVRGGHL